MYSNKTNINVLTALLTAHGVRDVVVCPGSRNAALVHNFNECPDISCHPVTDERSAGFFALGLRQQSCGPVAVCVTSGSALLNLAPAVAEATYQHQGIIVISADRPSAWIGQLDGQTMPQRDVFGKFVSFCADVDEFKDEQGHWECNRRINEALLVATGPSSPSVHINLRISEPLFEFSVERLPTERKIEAVYPDCDQSWDKLMDKLCGFERILLVCGQIPASLAGGKEMEYVGHRIAVLGESISSGVRCQTEQLVRIMEDMPSETMADFMPDCVIYLGGNTVSKKLRQFLRTKCSGACHAVVGPDGELHDVSTFTSLAVRSSYDTFLRFFSGALGRVHGQDYAEKWNALKTAVQCRHDSFTPGYSSMLAVKLFEEGVRTDDRVHYANSMPVRLGSIYSNHYCWCNRGLNGIDGSVSTASGASLARNGRLYCVSGDLSFFYDGNALWQQELDGRFRILLLNNSGGAVFHSLPSLEKSPAMDSLVAGSHGLDAEGICRQFGVNYLKAEDEAALKEAMKAFFEMSSDRPVLLEVRTDASMDQEVYSAYFKHISHGLEIN